MYTFELELSKYKNYSIVLHPIDSVTIPLLETKWKFNVSDTK